MFRTENKLKEHENVCKNHDYCYVEMPKEDRNILKYDHGEKYMKILFVIYADMESLLEKIGKRNSNLEKTSTTRISKHCFLLFIIYTLIQKTNMIIIKVKIV